MEYLQGPGTIIRNTKMNKMLSDIEELISGRENQQQDDHHVNRGCKQYMYSSCLHCCFRTPESLRLFSFAVCRFDILKKKKKSKRTKP